MADNFYSFSEPFNHGIDFYQADSNDVAVVLSGSVDLTVSAISVQLMQSNQSISADAITNVTKIAHAAADLSIDGATVTIATERQDGLVVLSAEVTVTQIVTKIAYLSLIHI